MGFRLSPKEDYEFEVYKDNYGGYEIQLPHQCGSWKILGFESSDGFTKKRIIDGVECVDDYPANPTDKDFAIKQMKLFIQRANEALEKLINL